MSSILCCVANQRPISTKLPDRKKVQAFDTEQRLFDFTATSSDSLMSLKTEEVQDIRQLFQDAKQSPSEYVQADRESSTHSHKPKSIATFLRRKLSRDNTKSHISLKSGHTDLKKPKHNIQRNLISDNSPKSGSYNLDAPIFDVDDIDLADHGILHRRRRKGCRPSIQNVQWAATAPTRQVIPANADII